MKVAISTDQGSVSAHFGRCQSYTIIEVKEGQLVSREEIPNPGHQPGYLPRYLSEKGVNCIIAGGMGPRAQGLFAENNIETIIGVQGPIDEIIEKFIKQELEAGEDLCGHKHGPEAHSPHDRCLEEINQPARTKICITSQGKDFEAEVDPNFGRARYFLIMDPETMDFEAVENLNIEAAQGAGIKSAQFIADKNVKILLTGNCGPNAQQVLQSSGIEVITGASGKVRDVFLKFRSKVK
jgi:predicted Fe-Mo cluster-binding NifX family protein